MSDGTETNNSETPGIVTEGAAPETTPPTEETTTETTPEFVPLTADAIQFPEGAQVDEALRDDFLSLMNNQDLTPTDRANGLVELSGKLLTAASEASSAAWNTMQETWQNEVRNDPQLGGAKLQSTMEGIGKLLEEHGSEELRQVLDITGAGNNLHVVRFLSSLASKLTETSTIVPGASPATVDSVAARMFPSMKG